jgi:hypothetical protein
MTSAGVYTQCTPRTAGAGACSTGVAQRGNWHLDQVLAPDCVELSASAHTLTNSVCRQKSVVEVSDILRALFPTEAPFGERSGAPSEIVGPAVGHRSRHHRLARDSRREVRSPGMGEATASPVADGAHAVGDMLRWSRWADRDKASIWSRTRTFYLPGR